MSEKMTKNSPKMTFFAVSVFRWVDRKIRPKYFGQVDRNFGRNFGFGRTLFTSELYDIVSGLLTTCLNSLTRKNQI